MEKYLFGNLVFPKLLGKRRIKMEMVWALILLLGVYEYMKIDLFDPKKHQVLDVVDVRTNNIDIKYSQNIVENVSGGYYSNGVLQNSEVRWVTEDFLKND